MRSDVTGAACLRDIVGVSATTSRVTWRAHLVTLRRFDTKVRPMVKIRPLIPWERRLAKSEIWEFQELTSWSRFGNRDYDRPFGDFLATLCRFD